MADGQSTEVNETNFFIPHEDDKSYRAVVGECPPVACPLAEVGD